MKIRRFEKKDAEKVSDLITTTIEVSNAKDYPPKLIEELIKTHTAEYVIKRAGWTHFYVAEEEESIIGCGAIGPFWDREDESALFTVFVHPAFQGRGVGRRIVETLERDELFLRAKRIEIAASITGTPFYLKLGYQYKNGRKEPDDELLIRMEKVR